MLTRNVNTYLKINDGWQPVVDEALGVTKGNQEDTIKISESVKQEIEKWKEWDGIHKISYDD